MKFPLAINLTPLPSPPKKNTFHTFHNSLCVSVWNQHVYYIDLDSRSGLSWNIFGCMPWGKVFRKASLASLTKEHVLRLAKSVRYNIFSHLVSFSYMGERLIPGLRRKDWILRALIVLSSKREIYLARWKLMLTSDQAKDSMAGSSMSPFQPLIYIRYLE